MILSTEEISQTLSMKSNLEVKILNDSKEFASVPAITNGLFAEVHYEGKL
jgi:FK506-binding protein 1